MKSDVGLLTTSFLINQTFSVSFPKNLMSRQTMICRNKRTSEPNHMHFGCPMFMLLFIPPLIEFANFITKYFILSKVNADEGVIQYLYHGLSACKKNNPLAKARDFLIVEADKPWYNYYFRHIFGDT